jgi:hypothetical protein
MYRGWMHCHNLCARVVHQAKRQAAEREVEIKQRRGFWIWCSRLCSMRVLAVHLMHLIVARQVLTWSAEPCDVLRHGVDSEDWAR